MGSLSIRNVASFQYLPPVFCDFVGELGFFHGLQGLVVSAQSKKRLRIKFVPIILGIIYSRLILEFIALWFVGQFRAKLVAERCGRLCLLFAQTFQSGLND
jgi:hypothetical protein